MCSTIIYSSNGRKYLAENYDYSLDHGLVGTNLRGTKKTNGRPPGDQQVSWSVKYGSVTFNQFSLEFPVSGMNEAGLSIALMWHEEGDFGDDKQFDRLNELQWIQYQLDNFRNIDEVIEGLQSIRPENGPVPLHFTLLDAHGESLLVEFIAGDLVLHRNVSYPILTNNSYNTCLVAAEKNEAITSLPSNSIGRFAHLYRQLSDCRKKQTSADGFRLLDSVSMSPENTDLFPWSKGDKLTVTAWSIVFDTNQKTIFLKTNRNKDIREFNLNEVDFDAKGGYQIADIHSGSSGSMMNFFELYSEAKNRKILRLSTQQMNMPEEIVDELASAVNSLYVSRQMI